MSFDLYFCWRTAKRFDRARLASFFAGIPNFQANAIPGENLQLWYENKTTGVYFSIDYENEPADPEPRVILPQGFYDTGISFNLNFNRSCFFAHEAMPWVALLARELGFWIVDLQEDWDLEPNVPRCYAAEELIASWERHNTRAVGALHKSAKPDEEVEYLYCPREKALYWWNYMCGKEKLQERLGSHVFVPSLDFFRKEQESTVLTSFIWSDALPQVFPQADIVIRNRTGKNWRGEIVSKQLQVLSPQDVLLAVGHLLTPCDGPVPGLRNLRPEDTKEIEKAFARLKGPAFKGMQRVGADGFVDVVIERGANQGLQ